MGEDADFFMGFLTGDADFGEGHDDTFTAVGGISAWILKCGWGKGDARSHEGEFLGYSLVYDGGVDDETGHHL